MRIIIEILIMVLSFGFVANAGTRTFRYKNLIQKIVSCLLPRNHEPLNFKKTVFLWLLRTVAIIVFNLVWFRSYQNQLPLETLDFFAWQESVYLLVTWVVLTTPYHFVSKAIVKFKKIKEFNNLKK